jgi:hypothetical protein
MNADIEEIEKDSIARAMEGSFMEGLFRYYEVEPTSENEAILRHLIHCWVIYTQRSKKYGSAWRRFGALNNLVRAAAKCERLLEQLWHKQFDETKDQDIDDAYDAINYLVFFIHQAGVREWRRG